MADVIRLPVARGRAESPAPVGAVVTTTLPWLGDWDVDDWGRDDTLARVAGGLARLRWRTSIGGVAHIPTADPAVRRSAGGALLVANSRRFGLTTWLVALALADATGRPVRFAGRPDTAPVGPLARRLGGLLARPDEVAGALRHGELVVIGAAGVFDPHAVGTIDHRLVGAAVAVGSPVVPAAVAISPMTRSARIELSAPVRPPRRRRGPLAELELTQRVAERLTTMLAEFGGPRTGTPLDWLGVGGVAGT